jgi:mannose-6-phosphate isomerase-like protein (cupin superfamily)
MSGEISLNPFLTFRQSEEREYGSIRLYDSAAAGSDQLPFLYSQFVVAPGSTSRRDQHEVLEVWVILSGSGKLLYDGGEYKVGPGDVVHFNSMRVHQVMNEGPEEMRVFSFWWKRG